jgi:Tfp pilus assembly protein PilZ
LEAKKVVSVLDKAFTILALMDYWDRCTSSGRVIWIDSRAGNYQYMGWADAAYVQFDELCKRMCEQRQTASKMKLEQMY